MADLARRQHGVLSSAQLLALGVTSHAIRRWLRAGRLHRLHRGVYALGHRALSAQARDLAAVIACGDRALLSHRSAGFRWGLVRASRGIEVTAPRSVGRHAGAVVHATRSLVDEDRVLIDSIPVTSPARTVVDLADVLSERRLADALHQAEVLRLLDLRQIENTLVRLPGRRGRHRLRRVIAAYGGGPPLTRSEAEVRFLQVCRDHAVAIPQANVSVGGYEVDFLWREAGLVVEVDGAAAHQTRRAFHEDRSRDRALAAQGIQVLRITWRDLRDGAALARQIEAIRRGRAA